MSAPSSQTSQLSYQPPTPLFTSPADEYVFGAEDDDFGDGADDTFPPPHQEDKDLFAAPPLGVKEGPKIPASIPHPFPHAANFSYSANPSGALLSSSSFASQHQSAQPSGAFGSYRSPQVGFASPTFSDASTTVSPRDVFGDDHIMKKTYPSLFGRKGGSLGNGPTTAGGNGTMDPAKDHVGVPQHHGGLHHSSAAAASGRTPVFHSPLAVDPSNTTSPRAIFAPLHSLRSADSYLSTSSEEEDEVPSPIILPEPQPRPSTSAPQYSSSMQYHFGPGVSVQGQASPAWSEGAGLGRELKKVDLGFKPLSGVDRFRAEEVGSQPPHPRSERDEDHYRPSNGPGLGKSLPGIAQPYGQQQAPPSFGDEDTSTEDGTYDSPRSAQLDLRQLGRDGAVDIDVDYDAADLPTSSEESDIDEDSAPYSGKGQPKLTAAAAARRAALATAGRGGAARRGMRGGKGLSRAVRGIGKPKGIKPRPIVSRGVSKVRAQGSASAGSSSGRASPNGEITYCPYIDPVTKRQCSASFVRFYDLKRHEETVHQMPPASTNMPGGKSTPGHPAGFWCEKCNKPFSRKDALIRHQKTIPDCWKNKGKAASKASRK